MPANTQQADQVLLSFRKRRSTPACYPCSQRKVRCRGARPCDACKARGHPGICHDEDMSKKRRRPRAGKPATNSPLLHESDPPSIGQPARPSPGLDTVPSRPQQDALQLPNSPSSLLPTELSTTPISGSFIEPSVGKFSAINFIRERLTGAHRTLNSDIHPSIGLGNTATKPPVAAPLHVGSTDYLTPPTREEIIQYYPPFRENVAVLYPFIHDTAALETTLHNILEGIPNIEPQYIAASLAVLALGAQFADTVTQPRRVISRGLINRSNAYLQQANYIFEPNWEVIQALLMIGMALQNCGQSDGAWALLGLNYRLAQILGLHTLDPDDGQGGMLWTSLIWQDALISLRYDRPPLSRGMGIDDVDQRQGLSYSQSIRSCCLLSIDMLQRSPSERVNVDYVLKSVDCLDGVLARSCDHLQPRQDMNRTFQQRLQRFALQLHSSLVLAEVCRPMFSIPGPSGNESHGKIRQRGLNALVANIEAFLELCKFSNIPLRLWSMTQAAVSCALVLALLDVKNPPLAVRPLLSRLSGALKIDTGSKDPVAAVTDLTDGLEGVCLMRVKAVGLLESILSTAPATSVEAGAIASHAVDAPISMPLDKLPDVDDLTWTTDLSWFNRAFADSVLDFEVDPAWYNSINWQD